MINMELPEPEQCEFCKTLLKQYAALLGYTEKDVDEKLPYLKPKKSWLSKGKGGSQVVTHYFRCPRCFPLIGKGWKVIDRRFNVREIGK